MAGIDARLADHLIMRQSEASFGWDLYDQVMVINHCSSLDFSRMAKVRLRTIYQALIEFCITKTWLPIVGWASADFLIAEARVLVISQTLPESCIAKTCLFTKLSFGWVLDGQDMATYYWPSLSWAPCSRGMVTNYKSSFGWVLYGQCIVISHWPSLSYFLTFVRQMYGKQSLAEPWLMPVWLKYYYQSLIDSWLTLVWPRHNYLWLAEPCIVGAWLPNIVSILIVLLKRIYSIYHSQLIIDDIW